MSNFRKIAHDAAARSASTGEDSTSLIVNTSARNTKRKEAGYKPINLPVYDKGGDVDVSMEASRRLQSSGDAGIQSLINAPDEQAPAKAAPAKAPAGGGLIS